MNSVLVHTVLLFLLFQRAGIKGQRVFDLMRSAHGRRVGVNSQRAVKTSHRDHKGGISLRIDRKKLLLVNPHIVVVGAAPYDRRFCLSVLYLDHRRGFHRRTAGPAGQSGFYSIGSICETEIFHSL